MTHSIQVPQNSSVRLTSMIEDAAGQAVTRELITSIKLVAYDTANRDVLTLDATLSKVDVILASPGTSSTGRKFNFLFTTPATALPTPGDYEIVLRVTQGANGVVAAEVFPVSVIAAG